MWNGKSKRPIKKINVITGEVVQEYPSINKAAIENETTTAQIVRVLDHKSYIHRGYMWKSKLV